MKSGYSSASSLPLKRRCVRIKVCYILIARPKSPYSGTPFPSCTSGTPSACKLSSGAFLLLPPLKKYYTPNGDQDDLISIGTIGLIKGVSTFKPDKNVRLATYASRCIENEILMYFRSQRKLQGELSLSDSLDGDGENSSLSLIDVVRVDDNMLEELDLRDACAQVRQCVNTCLTGREAHIIRLRYGLGNQAPLTQREIASLCGISRSYVSRIEKKALEKLRFEYEKKRYHKKT